MTLIEIKPRLTVGAGRFLKHPALSRCFQRNVRQLITRRAARVFAQVRFAFWIQAAGVASPAARQSKAESPSALDLLMKAYRLQGMVVLPFPNSFYGNGGTKFPKKAERRLSLCPQSSPARRGDTENRGISVTTNRHRSNDLLTSNTPLSLPSVSEKERAQRENAF
jgi:hypothetical protein